MLLALSPVNITSSAPGLYFFIVFDLCVASQKPLFLPLAFSASLSLFWDLTFLARFFQVWATPF